MNLIYQDGINSPPGKQLVGSLILIRAEENLLVSKLINTSSCDRR